MPSPFVKSGRPFEDAVCIPSPSCPGPTVPPRTCDSSSSFQLIHNRSLSPRCAAPTGDHNRGLFPRGHLDVSIMNHPLLRQIVLNRQLAQTKKSAHFTPSHSCHLCPAPVSQSRHSNLHWSPHPINGLFKGIDVPNMKPQKVS